jgi:carbamoyl-phosphate synthase large subunit
MIPTRTRQQRSQSRSTVAWLPEAFSAAFEVAKAFQRLGFGLRATEGTCHFLAENGIPCERMNKHHEGRSNIVDGIMNREIHLIINTAFGKRSKYDDSYIRKAAIKYKISYVTTMSAALAAAQGIADIATHSPQVRSLQEYHGDING